MKTHTSSLLLSLAWLGLDLFGGAPARAALPEPDSLFYGRIINRTSGQEYQLVDGDLAWTLRKPNGALVVFRGQLEPLLDGQFSYRCKVPHQALALGVTVSDHVVPLAANPLAYALIEITVDGVPARVLPPAEETLVAAQPDRASTYRVDLELFDPLLDSDGDGIPDWWEELHGADDPTDDRDGDGWNALGEFKEGSDPDRDDRVPSLLDSEHTIYADGTSGLALTVLDADSSGAQLVYTLESLPTQGALHLRNATPDPASPDVALSIGDTFTQADVEAGRLVFVHAGPGSAAVEDGFAVSLRDEDPLHDAFTGELRLRVYRPTGDLSEGAAAQALAGMPRQLPAFPGVSAGLARMMTSYLLSREQGHIIWDASRASAGISLRAASSGLSPEAYDTQFVPAFGEEKPQLLAGGAGPDLLAGGMAHDVLIGGRGPDHLTGLRGSDLFVLGEAGDGDDVIGDFNPADGDTIDLSQSLRGASGSLRDYVQLSHDGVDSYIRIDADGDGGGYTDRVVTLEGQALESDTLHDLVEQGNLLTGDKTMPARITIVADNATASENGPVPGTFLLRRGGSAASSLSVNLQISGSALNGSDYAWLPSLVTLQPGETERTLTVVPYVDTLTELSEVVEIIVLAGADYEVSEPSRAQLWIEDLAPRLTLETLESPAVRDPLRPGYILLSRSGVLDRSLLVRLDIDGTASGGSDYESISSFVSLPAFQTTHLIEVRPKATADLGEEGAESVVVGIRPDASYALGSASIGGLMIIDREMTFSQWMQSEFPESTQQPSDFAAGDQGELGVRNLDRYAFGLDPLDPGSASATLPRYEMVDGHLSVSFRERAALTDLRFVVEVTQDFHTWHSDPGYVKRLELAPPEALETRYFRAVQSSDQSSLQFMRVRVIYAP